MRQCESGPANEDLLWVLHVGLTISLDGLSLFDMHCIHASFCQYSKIWVQSICNWTMLTKIDVEELHCLLMLLKIPQDEHYVPIAQNVWSTFYITCVDSSFRFKEGCFFSALCLQISEKDFSQAIKREHHFCEMDQTSSEKCRIYGETVDFTFYSPKGTID